jgi:hypothetical protein
LQELVRIFKEISEFVARSSESFCGELRSDLDSCNRRVFRDVANFINPNARLASQRIFQLFGQGRRLGIAAGKGADEPRKLRLSKTWREVNAGDSGTYQQLCETAFTRGGA